MSAQRDASTSVHPWVQAQRMENASRGQLAALAMRNADLAAADLPPQGLAVVGGADASADWVAAIRVAAWLADVMVAAGLADAAATLYEAQRDRAPGSGSHVWRAKALASAEVARRVLGAAAVQAAADLEADAATPGGAA